MQLSFGANTTLSSIQRTQLKEHHSPTECSGFTAQQSFSSCGEVTQSRTDYIELNWASNTLYLFTTNLISAMNALKQQLVMHFRRSRLELFFHLFQTRSSVCSVGGLQQSVHTLTWAKSVLLAQQQRPQLRSAALQDCRNLSGWKQSSGAETRQPHSCAVISASNLSQLHVQVTSALENLKPKPFLHHSPTSSQRCFEVPFHKVRAGTPKPRSSFCFFGPPVSVL